MARRSRGRSAETSDFANSPYGDELLNELLRPVEPLPSLSPLVSRLDEFTGESLPYDRRLFSFGEPERYSLVTAPVSQGGMFSREPALNREVVAFREPSTVAICHRREVRREVMIAKRQRGSGGARRRDWKSEVKC